MSITVNQLSKRYGEQKAVHNITFHIDRSEIVGFLGPNGAGKSTTMKMITGYLEPSGGTIEVCGIPVEKNSIETKRKIGYLPEANPLYAEMYVKEYLKFISNLHKVANPGKRIADVISLVDLGPEAHKKCGQLSKGYKQRVGLAAALVHDPEVLILDEPTSGLDPNQIIGIRDVIRRLGQNKTVLISSHIMQEVEAVCERAIIINKGQLVADDNLENLKRSGSDKLSVTVHFNNKVNSQDLKDSITFITGIRENNINNGSAFIISSPDPELLKKELLRFSIQHNLDITSLQTTSDNLESVFRSLTASR